jgi:hypothetical protein
MNTPSPTDVESLLRSLSPESLSVNRDELFFQAGYAAGAKTKGARLFWPSAAAALLVFCIGLGVAVQRQTVALHSALAAAERGANAHPSAVATDNPTKPTSEAKSQDVALAEHDHQFLAQNGQSNFDEQRVRDWEKLATANFREHDRLTARGLVESREDFLEPASESDEASPELRSRPKTYFELRQLHLEG